MTRMDSAIASSDDRIANTRQLVDDCRRALNRECRRREMWPERAARDGACLGVVGDCSARVERAAGLIAISEELIKVARTLM